VTQTILFPSVGAVECAFQQRIGSHLRDNSNDVETVYFTLSERARKQFPKSQPIENARKVVSEHTISQETISNLLSYFLDSEQDSETAKLRGHIKADRTIEYRSGDIELQFFRYFDVVEQYLTEWDVDFVFMDFGAELFRTAVMEAAKRNDIPFVYPKYAPIPNGDYFCLLDQISNVQSVLNDFREYELTEQEMEFVETAEETFTDLDSLFGPTRFPSVTKRKIKRFFETFCHDIRYEKFGNPYYSTYWATKRNLEMVARKHVSDRYRQPMDLDEQYVFFPLHSPDDAQLTMRAPQYTNQAALAEILAKSLPPGWTLYVKEHPAFVGGYELSTLDQIAQIDNAKLVNPTLNARRLAKNADTVIVINSKAGLESLYLKTPVIVLGDPFYSQKGLTHDVTDLGELPTVLRTLVQQDGVETDAQTLGKLLCRLRDESYAGRVIRRDNPATQTNKDAKQYAEAIQSEMTTRGIID